MNNFYKDKYDVIIVGGAISGLASALKLIEEGKDVLVLEQHNIPGGVATSFVRGGTEFEASLHEFDAIGTKECPLENRLIFEHYGLDIEWVRLPIGFRYKDKDIDCVVHCGKNGDYTVPAKDIADALNDENGEIYNNLLRFFKLCRSVYLSMTTVSRGNVSKIKMVTKHHDFVKTIGYSFEEVVNFFSLPKKAIDILSVYWIYLGSPTRDMPFTIYAYVLTDILFYGGYIPRHTSYEIAIKMMDKVIEMGGQVELKQRVDKILVKDGHVQGVRLQNGRVLHSDYVISGAYPNVVYTQMIEPLTEVPKQAIKLINSMEIGLTPFVLNMLLDKDYKELNLKDYALFYALDECDNNQLFDNGTALHNWGFYNAVCLNAAIPEVSKPGTTLYSITYLPQANAFNNIDIKDYQKVKDELVNYFLESESKRLGIDLKSHIIEIITETPYTISRYTTAPFGAIYGYRHTMSNHPIARFMMKDSERYIKGLSFNGATQVIGDGMGPAIQNGIIAAQEILSDIKREKK